MGTGRSAGPDFFAGRLREPRLEFWALRVDLTNPGLAIVISRSELSAHVTGFTDEYNCIAGINTTPFYPSSDREGEERTIVGITVSGGKLISPPVPRYDALVFYRDGSAAIVNQGEINDFSRIENAAGGFYKVLDEGRLSERLLESKGGEPRQDLPRHSRSAVGLSVDGKTLFLLVVDGMRPGSIGATEAELGLLLKQLGSFNGLNLDGGGSSVLAIRSADGKTRAVNTPIHNRIPGLQRGVAACLGIRVL